MDEGILEVSELAGDRVVELRVVDELHVVGLITCEREGVVVSDEAPLGGVAQVIGHGVRSLECMERKERKRTRKCGWKQREKSSNSERNAHHGWYGDGVTDSMTT